MPIVNILTVIDTAKIAYDKRASLPNSSFDNPVSLAQGYSYLYMVVDSNFLLGENAISELSIKVRSGDVIRWRFFAIDHGQTYSPIVVQFETNYDNDVDVKSFLNPDPPSFTKGSINVYEAPDSGNLDGPPASEHIHDNYFETSVVQAPTTPTPIAYQWKIKLVDQNDSVLGYFDWDPHITINP